MEQKQTLRIVVASPSDVKAERDLLHNVIEELNRGVAADRGLRLELSRWETDAHPGFHAEGPQGLIDRRLKITDCDLLIGIFWKRFGTPTPDGQTGTEHEINLAINAWKKKGSPQIFVYFSQKPYTPKSKSEAEQWRQVLEFKEKFPAEGLWGDYNDEKQFEDFARNHLSNFIRSLDLPQPEKGKKDSMGSEPLNPLLILQEAIKAVPSVKYALGVAGVSATVAIILGLLKDPKIAVWGTLIVIGLMFILVIFSYAAQDLPSKKWMVASLAWAVTTLFILALASLFTSLVFGVPQQLASYIAPIAPTPNLASPTPTPNLASPAPTPELIILISHPKDGGEVTRYVDFNGTIIGEVPDGHELWLYLYDKDNNLYYFDPVDVFSDGKTWQVKNVIVGSESPNDKGATYKVGIGQVSKSDGDRLRREPDELRRLPQSITKHAEITIYRK
jgi:hypothetical protein